MGERTNLISVILVKIIEKLQIFRKIKLYFVQPNWAKFNIIKINY